MHRILVSTDDLRGDSPQLSKDAMKHLRVVRPEKGEIVELFDGRGHRRRYSWDGGLSPDGELEEIPPPRGRRLMLFACVTKGSRWDWTIEKATELGVAKIVPVISDRTIVRIPSAERAAKRERWQRIAEDAARQSDACWIPEIAEPVDFAKSLESVRETTCFVGALVTPPARPLAAAFAERKPGGDVAVYVGPEGDFTPAELAALLECAVPTSFGPLVLRAETAAIFALSVLRGILDSEP